MSLHSSNLRMENDQPESCNRKAYIYHMNFECWLLIGR
jgi:hypothetical protein